MVVCLLPLQCVSSLPRAEREQLESWSRRPTSAQALVLRSRTALAAAGGASNAEIGRRLAIKVDTAEVVVESGLRGIRLAGLLDEPRPGQPRKITDAQVDDVITRTLETMPKDATHWSTRSMAAEVGLNQAAVPTASSGGVWTFVVASRAPVRPLSLRSYPRCGGHLGYRLPGSRYLAVQNRAKRRPEGPGYGVRR